MVGLMGPQLKVELYAREIKPGTVPPVEISRLYNSYMYRLTEVFIVKQGDTYRLVVIDKKDIICDETYKSAKGARIAFLKLNGYKLIEGSTANALWSKFVQPDYKWIEKHIPPLKKSLTPTTDGAS